jgi:hypothetical protein
VVPRSIPVHEGLNGDFKEGVEVVVYKDVGEVVALGEERSDLVDLDGVG